MRQVRLSICIPTYNFGEFIGETLESMIGQVGDDVEIVVGDGGSTDNTAEVIGRYRDIFPRLIYQNFGKKGGIDQDLIKTVALAQGEYCWLMSADDVPKPGSVSRVVNELQNGHSIYLCNRIDCDRSLREIRKRSWLSKKVRDNLFDLSNNSELRRYLDSALGLGALFSYISSIIVRRSDWDSVKDNELFIGSNYAHVHRLFSIAQNGGRLKYIDDPLIWTRLYNDSFMANGITRRYFIDLDGYQLLAYYLFSNDHIRDAIKLIMRREHKWYFFSGVRSQISKKEWGGLERRLYSYGYSRIALYLARNVGQSRWMLLLARRLRNLWEYSK